MYKAAVIAVHQLQLFVPATTSGKSDPLARSEEESLLPARTEGPTMPSHASSWSPLVVVGASHIAHQAVAAQT